MKSYIFITNIPAPYRISFYNELYKKGFNFEVYYMRYTEDDRSWKIEPCQIKHPYYIDKGYYKMKGRYHFHFNPKLLYKLLRNKTSEFIIAGSWNDLDVLILVLLKRIGIIKNQFHFWTEANYLTIGSSHDNSIKRIIRKFVYTSSNGAQLSSGKMTELTFDKWGIPVNKFITLPNTIEEEKYIISDREILEREKNPIPVFILPVRLDEKIKGVLNFFKAIGFENIKQAMFWIAGDGPDKEKYCQYIENNNLQNNIKILGHCDIDKLLHLYIKANAFILPSFTDASPLSLIEALCMHLPVLVSQRCGNHFEAVVEGENGYLFNPFEPNSIKKAYETMLKRKEQYVQMGHRSGELYKELFDKENVIRSFIKEITKFSAEKW